MDYSEAFSDLANVYLEDSWVLQVLPSERAVSFEVDAVLDPGHPRHSPRKPGEQYCYLAGWLTVQSREPLDVRLSGSAPDTSPAGREDVGNIDSFVEESPGAWLLEGSWGSARVANPAVTLRFTSAPSSRQEQVGRRP